MYWDSDSWEEHIVFLAKRFHRSVGFQKVFDADHGDNGLEGYSFDGVAYQCYVPEREGKRPLIDRIIDKVNKDTYKLKKYQKDLEKMLQVTLKRWELVVPREYLRDKAIAEHLGKRRKEVASWGLPYLAEDIKLAVSDDSIFQTEKEEILRRVLSPIVIDTGAPPDEVISSWKTDNVESESKLEQKLSRTPLSGKSLEGAKTSFIKYAILGQNNLHRIRKADQDAWELIKTAKERKEGNLELESLTTNLVPLEFLRKIMSEYASDLRNEVPVLDKEGAIHLANEAVADWLMRCPMMFRTDGEY